MGFGGYHCTAPSPSCARILAEVWRSQVTLLKVTQLRSQSQNSHLGVARERDYLSTALPHTLSVPPSPVFTISQNCHNSKTYSSSKCILFSYKPVTR